VKELVRFGAPLIPISIAALILSVADRYFLQYYSSLTEVGIYSVGYKLGSVLQLPIGAFQIAWPTIMFSVYKTPQAKSFYSRLLTYFCLSLGILSLFIAVFAQEAIHLIATPEYSKAWQIVPIVTLSQIALGIVYATAVGINVKKRPEHIMVAWLIGVCIHLGLNYALIPAYGMIGAAISTMIGYITVAVGATIASLRLYQISYQYKRLIKLTAAFSLIYVCSLFLPDSHFWIRSVFKLLLFCTFPLILWAFGFFTEDEITLIKSYLHFPTRQPTAEPAAKTRSSEDDRPGLS
jgi:O-antigen/teichoic acid export membrane protein